MVWSCVIRWSTWLTIISSWVIFNGNFCIIIIIVGWRNSIGSILLLCRLYFVINYLLFDCLILQCSLCTRLLRFSYGLLCYGEISSGWCLILFFLYGSWTSFIGFRFAANQWYLLLVFTSLTKRLNMVAWGIFSLLFRGKGSFILLLSALWILIGVSVVGLNQLSCDWSIRNSVQLVWRSTLTWKFNGFSIFCLVLGRSFKWSQI